MTRPAAERDAYGDDGSEAPPRTWRRHHLAQTGMVGERGRRQLRGRGPSRYRGSRWPAGSSRWLPGHGGVAVASRAVRRQVEVRTGPARRSRCGNIATAAPRCSAPRPGYRILPTTTPCLRPLHVRGGRSTAASRPAATHTPNRRPASDRARGDEPGPRRRLPVATPAPARRHRIRVESLRELFEEVRSSIHIGKVLVCVEHAAIEIRNGGSSGLLLRQHDDAGAEAALRVRQDSPNEPLRVGLSS